MNKSLLARINQNCRGWCCQWKEHEGNQVKKQHEEDYPYLEAIHSSNKLSQGSLHQKTAGQPIKLKDNLLFLSPLSPAWMVTERSIPVMNTYVISIVVMVGWKSQRHWNHFPQHCYCKDLIFSSNTSGIATPWCWDGICEIVTQSPVRHLSLWC